MIGVRSCVFVWLSVVGRCEAGVSVTATLGIAGFFFFNEGMIFER